MTFKDLAKNILEMDEDQQNEEVRLMDSSWKFHPLQLENQRYGAPSEGIDTYYRFCLVRDDS